MRLVMKIVITSALNQTGVAGLSSTPGTCQWSSMSLCRNPVDHLMSNCNFKRKVFDCNADLASEIEKCLVKFNRFSAKLESSFDNIHLKCFDFRKAFTEYIEYMGKRLQRKRIQAQYAHRETNRPRNKTNECIWSSHVYEALEAHLVENYDYYSFCNRCIGSEDDLLA